MGCLEIAIAVRMHAEVRIERVARMNGLHGSGLLQPRCIAHLLLAVRAELAGSVLTACVIVLAAGDTARIAAKPSGAS